MDDDVFLPDNMTQFEESRGNTNVTILSESAMDITCSVIRQGSSTSTACGGSVESNFTILTSSDMDLTECVITHVPDSVPNIMLTRPSDEEMRTENLMPFLSHVESKVSPAKLNAAAFLKKLSTEPSEKNTTAQNQQTATMKPFNPS